VALIKPRPGAAPGGRIREKADAEDVVHDAFYGLYRRWDKLADKQKAQQYLRSSVLNGCRTELRRGHRRARQRDSPRAESRVRLRTWPGPFHPAPRAGQAQRGPARRRATGEAMSTLEDEIRAATRARAQEITRASIPPPRFNSTGSVLIVSSSPGQPDRVGVLRGNRLMLLPQPAGAEVWSAAW
jgi:hypothetical protein